ncbi:MAG: shikimate kinase [Hyphomicrobiales bacterium]|nr:shikimate kinase [Hyphomicrobiales bacterium]
MPHVEQPRPASNAVSAPEIVSGLAGKSIAMIGLMGAGKSAIARRLALRLDLPYVDADAEIEAAAGQTIEEIFANHGEGFFRDGERRVIARLLESGPLVLATGGGAYMNAETRDRMRARAVTIWLKADLPVLMSRVARRDNRPLLKTGDPRAVMERLIAERYPVYALADITIESRDVAHEVIVEEIMAALAEIGSRNGL